MEVTSKQFEPFEGLKRSPGIYGSVLEVRKRQRKKLLHSHESCFIRFGEGCRKLKKVEMILCVLSVCSR